MAKKTRVKTHIRKTETGKPTVVKTHLRELQPAKKQPPKKQPSRKPKRPKVPDWILKWAKTVEEVKDEEGKIDMEMLNDSFEVAGENDLRVLKLSESYYNQLMKISDKNINKIEQRGLIVPENIEDDSDDFWYESTMYKVGHQLKKQMDKKALLEKRIKEKERRRLERQKEKELLRKKREEERTKRKYG